MRVLLNGGNAALRRSAIAALLARGHQVRLVAPDALDLAGEWPAHVEPWPTPADAAMPVDAMRACDAVVILPDTGRERARDAGRTADDHQQIADAAARAGVRRVILATGWTGGEVAPRRFPGDWLVIRTADVYGIADDLVSVFLVMMRSLPAVPVLSDRHALQPVWHEDFSAAVAASLSLDTADLNREVFVAGPDRVTERQLYDRLALLIDRRPLQVPIPDFLATYGSKLAEALGLSGPLQATQLAFADSGEGDDDRPSNALSAIFGVTPTPLDRGLSRLVKELVELTPADGVGRTEIKRFSADIHGSPLDAAGLLREFRTHFAEMMPIVVGVEPGSREVELRPGATLTMNLPGRGNVQVRVQEVTDRSITLATLRGHAVAGLVRFATTPIDGGVRFEVMTVDAPANPLDWLGLTLGGSRLQDANWTTVVQNVVGLSGGTSGKTESDARKVTGEEAESVDRWARELIRARRSRVHADTQIT